MVRNAAYCVLLLSSANLWGQELDFGHRSDASTALIGSYEYQGSTGRHSSDNSTLSLPLSIVNMPINIGVSIGGIQYDGVSQARLSASAKLDPLGWSSQLVSEINLKVELEVESADDSHIKLALSQQKLPSESWVNFSSASLAYDFSSFPKLGMAYQWQEFSLVTELELKRNHQVGQSRLNSQFWRLGGELKSADWLYFKAGMHYDLANKQDEIYYLGTGLSFNNRLKLDVTGVYGDDTDFGGLIQTSYHF